MPGMDIFLPTLAYGLGCINAAYYLLRWRDGRDIRQLGSGNAGARNIGRVLGRGAFALVFLLDAAKGIVAVSAANAWVPAAAPLCAIAVTLGHVFPVQLGWRGGKGVAAAIGAVAMLDLQVLAIAAGAFVFVRAAGQRTMSAALLALMSATAFALVFKPMGVALAALGLAALLVLSHTERMPWRRPVHSHHDFPSKP